MKKIVSVSAVVLINQNKQILMSTRPAGKSMAGFWEFPGGKLENGETYIQAGVREMNEELGVKINEIDLELFEKIFHQYDDFSLKMKVFLCRLWQGEIIPQENQSYNWFLFSEIDFDKVVPADMDFIKRVFDYV